MVQPLRLVSARNRESDGLRSLSGLNLSFLVRTPRILAGTNISEFVVNFLNIYVSTTAIVDVANSVTINKVSLEYGSTYVPFTFSGGRSRTMTSGEVDVQSDPIAASLLNLPSVHNGTTVWIRIEGSISAAGSIPAGTGDTTAIAGVFASEYNPAATIVTKGADGTGSFTWTGTNINTNSNEFIMPVLLGRFVSGDPLSIISKGDSLMLGVGDTWAAAGAIGPGFAARSVHTSGANVIPLMNCGRSGSYASTFADPSNKLSSLDKYANTLLEVAGTNDMVDFTPTPASLYAACKVIWDKARANGITRIFRMGLTPRTSSTDSWATLANQTTNGANYAAGAAVDQFNALLAAGVGSDLTAYVPSPARDATQPTKWVVNGTANYATADAIHGTAASYELIATNALRPLYALYAEVPAVVVSQSYAGFNGIPTTRLAI